MRIGVCTGDCALKSEGLDFIEGPVAGMLCPLEGPETFAGKLSVIRSAARPMEAVNMLFPGAMKTTGPSVDAAAIDAYVRTTCTRAAQAGIKLIVYGSGGSRKVPEGFSRERAAAQIVEHLVRWGPVAASCGVTIVLEPLRTAECNIVNTVAEGASLVRAAGQPSVRLLADTYHMACEGEGPDSISLAGELIAHVHCADPEGRVPLGFGPADHRPYFRALKGIGYRGRVSIEARWTDVAAQLAAALAALRRQIDES